MKNGTVKKLVAERGFGFISGDAGDIFFHHSGVIMGTIETLHEGQPVSYDVEDDQSGKGPRAINVAPDEARRAGR